MWPSTKDRASYVPALSHCPAELDSSAWLLGPAWGEHHTSSVRTHPGCFRGSTHSILSLTVLIQALGALFPYLEHFQESLDLSSSRCGRPQGDQGRPRTARQRWASFGALAQSALGTRVGLTASSLLSHGGLRMPMGEGLMPETSHGTQVPVLGSCSPGADGFP